MLLCLAASVLLKQNVVALIEGGHSTVSACVLSTFTGIPLIRLHDDHDHCYKKEHVLSLSASYSSHARATMQLLNEFHLDKVAVLYEGKTSVCHTKRLLNVTVLQPFELFQ